MSKNGGNNDGMQQEIYWMKMPHHKYIEIVIGVFKMVYRNSLLFNHFQFYIIS